MLTSRLPSKYINRWIRIKINKIILLFFKESCITKIQSIRFTLYPRQILTKRLPPRDTPSDVRGSSSRNTGSRKRGRSQRQVTLSDLGNLVMSKVAAISGKWSVVFILIASRHWGPPVAGEQHPFMVTCPYSALNYRSWYELPRILSLRVASGDADYIPDISLKKVFNNYNHVT